MNFERIGSFEIGVPVYCVFNPNTCDCEITQNPPGHLDDKYKGFCVIQIGIATSTDEIVTKRGELK